MASHAINLPSLTTMHPLEGVVRRTLMGALAILVLAYIYFVASSTFNIIARKQALQEGVAIQSSLARINAEYYALSGELTPERAAIAGLVPLEDKAYVSRTVPLGFAGGN